MSIYEKYWFRLFLAGCAAVAAVTLAACHTVRTSTVESVSDNICSEIEETQNDTTVTASDSVGNILEGATVLAHEGAEVKIEHDSVGRIIAIQWVRSIYGQSLKTRQEQGSRWFYGINATRRSEVRDSTKNHSEAREETQKEVSYGSKLESVIGMSLVGCIILFYLIDWLYRIWKRRREK